MRTTTKRLLSCCVMGMLSTVAYGTEFSLRPVGATGAHTIDGGEIILQGGGQVVTLDIRVDDWRGSAETGLGICGDGITVCDLSDPDCPGGGACAPNSGIMGGWQATIDSSGYAGVLGPFFAECTENGNCQEYDPFPAGTCNIGEGVCNPDSCAFIDWMNRSDYAFYGLNGFAPMSYATLDYGYLGAIMNPPTGPTYGGVEKYCGTLVLDVPDGTAGSFTVGFIEGPAVTTVMDDSAIPIVPLVLIPAVITIGCQTNEDCDDGEFCTGIETCVDGSCQSSGDPCASNEWCDDINDTCVPYGTGDFDSDGDVDLDDTAAFVICFGQSAHGGCEPGNTTGDAMIDLDDFALFAAAMDGPQ